MGVQEEGTGVEEEFVLHTRVIHSYVPMEMASF